jgi:hypothetical protein
VPPDGRDGGGDAAVDHLAMPWLRVGRDYDGGVIAGGAVLAARFAVVDGRDSDAVGAGSAPVAPADGSDEYALAELRLLREQVHRARFVQHVRGCAHGRKRQADPIAVDGKPVRGNRLRLIQDGAAADQAAGSQDCQDANAQFGPFGALTR